jgi:pimeloyl-ACP methyl ester carboxylesterase
LFLHPGDGFDDNDPFLKALAAHYEVLAPWHPGFGHSDLPKGWNSVDDLAYFYLDFLDQLNLEDAVVIGASFGGWIAAELAIRRTPRMAKLVLIDALGIRLGDRTTRDIADFHNTDATLLESLTWADPAGRQGDPSTLDDHELTGMTRSREAFAHYGWRPYMHNPGLVRWLHRIDVPTLVLWGEEDGVVKPEYGQAYAGLITGAAFEAVPSAGHYPHIEQMDASAKIVRDFIDG